MRKAHRELKKLAARYGRRVEHTKNGHFKLICLHGERDFVIVASSSSDARSGKNMEADLKRRG